MKWFWDHYLPDGKTKAVDSISVTVSIGQLKGQPPALIITDENDVIRNGGEAYAHKLVQAE
jgi:acetyl esterase